MSTNQLAEPKTDAEKYSLQGVSHYLKGEYEKAILEEARNGRKSAFGSWFK